MDNWLVDTMVLQGEDAINFANSLFRPTQEEIASHNEFLNRIDSNVKIKKTEGGFEAEIADLDLSFLNHEPLGININLEVSFAIKVSDVFYSNDANEISEATIVVGDNNKYNKSQENKYWSWAA